MKQTKEYMILDANSLAEAEQDINHYAKGGWLVQDLKWLQHTEGYNEYRVLLKRSVKSKPEDKLFNKGHDMFSGPNSDGDD